jgi:RHS repeat-associated protein
LKATTNAKVAVTNQPVLLKASNPSFAVNLRFPGQYADEESKLYYNGFRSYRPMMGDYPQMDPSGLAAG